MSKPELRLIAFPYHDGVREVGMGLGPLRLVEDPCFVGALEQAGWSVVHDDVPAVNSGLPEVARVVELARRLAGHVSRATDAGAFPLVLAGNCNSCLGTAAGIGGHELGVVWFDAHADFDTPDDNVSGFFDVMALAILTGNGWGALRRTIPGLTPVDERNVVLAGVRDLEPHQRDRLERSRLNVVHGPGDLAPALEGFGPGVRRVYLHVDLDALDAEEGRANGFAAHGGPSLERLLEWIDAVFDRYEIAAAAMTAYDPQVDGDGAVATAAGEIARSIGRRALEQR
jgi:arginase